MGRLDAVSERTNTVRVGFLVLDPLTKGSDLPAVLIEHDSEGRAMLSKRQRPEGEVLQLTLT